MSYLDIKYGDVVHIRGQVISRTDHTADVRIHNGQRFICVDRVAIVHVEPSPIRVGDTVVCKGMTHDTSNTGKVVAVHCGRAWVVWNKGGDGTPFLADLERVP